MSDSKHYDAIIIGSGQAASPMAKYLSKQGMQTALVERRYLGGTCVNTGCTPTKMLVGSAKAAHDARDTDRFGVRVSDVQVDFSKVIKRKDDMVIHSRENQEESLGNTKNLEIIYGNARFDDDKTLTVALNEGGNQQITADRIFINTGADNLIPPVEGLDQVDIYDNRTIMELDELPEHLIIIGGGYIGLEFGQMFRRFGSKVSIFHAPDRILDIEDEDICAEMTKILTDEGIDIYTNCKITRIRREEKEIVLSGEQGGGISEDHRCSHILFATGRKPNTEGLGLENTRIKTDDKGHIKCNNQLETDAPGVYVMGDVKGGPQFTHVSYNDYIILKQNLFEGGNATTDERPLTYTVFTDPQLGRVGLNEQQAKKQGVPYRVATMPMSKVARAQEMGDTRGLMKVLVGDDDRLLGASVLGMEGGELAGAFLFAMIGGVTYQQLRDAMIAHPTLLESVSNLFADL
jgi:pyruvate/2-oxoglutarate dehydrogenase complex dihydrolipoamide dehydrogenase (E3) component